MQYVVGIGNPMNKAALVCVPPRKGFSPTKAGFQTGCRLKRLFNFPDQIVGHIPAGSGG